ncbi:MAG: DNA replication/repair protein RecF [Deltaproteobacteria bacterium]|nr:DNA replication/repair protein RecF [Deltaproteobacteria bacterium]
MNRVHLAELEISNFRNLENLAIKPHKRFNIVAGRNGMGKTNLLEAIYLMGALRSFRTTARSELVGYEKEGARVRGVFSGAAAGLCCEIGLTDKKRVIRVDGKTASAGGEHFRSLPMVLFHPATMALVQTGPDTRRRFLDRALFQADMTYPRLHRDYMTALKSRNKLLKQSPPAKDAIAAFDGQLSSIGARISEKRAGIIETMGPFFKEAVDRIGVGLSAIVSYKPKVEGGEEEILEALARRLELDLIRGYTSVGPHADDMEIEVNGRPARRFASQGQQRMIALSLKIAETNVLAQTTERIPILLLDDISSELDRERNRQLFEFLGGVGGQVFITTTHFDHILLEGERMDFVMQDGVLTDRPAIPANCLIRS